MLKSRWLSTFTVIGIVLIALGIVGLILGPRFVFDPGQPVTGKEAWCYLAIGVLMLVNGLLTPALPEEQNPPQSTRKNSRSASSNAQEQSKTREAAVSAIEKRGE